MNKFYTTLGLLGSLTVAACGGGDDAQKAPGASETAATADSNSMGTMPGMTGNDQSAATGETHTGSGDVTEVSGERVTISHGPVESIGWPAMTMTFQPQSPDLVQGVNVGDPVNFQFQKVGEGYVLTSLSKAQQ